MFWWVWWSGKLQIKQSTWLYFTEYWFPSQVLSVIRPERETIRYIWLSAHLNRWCWENRISNLHFQKWCDMTVRVWNIPWSVVEEQTVVFNSFYSNLIKYPLWTWIYGNSFMWTPWWASEITLAVPRRTCAWIHGVRILSNILFRYFSKGFMRNEKWHIWDNY